MSFKASKLLILCSLIIGCGNGEDVANQDETESFQLHILVDDQKTEAEQLTDPLAQLINSRCMGCHGTDANLSLSGLLGGEPLSIDLKEKIVQRVLLEDGDPLRMPIGQVLSEEQKEIFTNWQKSNYYDISGTAAVTTSPLKVDYSLVVIEGSNNQTMAVTEIPYSIELKKGRYGLLLIDAKDPTITYFEGEIDLSKNTSIQAKATNQGQLSSLWIDRLVGLTTSGEINSVQQLMSWLPQPMLNNFVLMETSQSRHKASVKFPRLILFGADARFIVGIGTDPTDTNLNTIELIEFNQKEQIWRLRAIDFNSPDGVKDNDEDCKVCHGSPARPIWGSYRDWPGAFGNDDDSFTAEQLDVLRNAENKSSGNQRLEALNINVQPTSNGRDYISIAGRRYGYNNTVFNQELGPLQALANHQRLKTNNDYELYKKLIIANTIRCTVDIATPGSDLLAKIRRSVGGSYGIAEKTYIKLGLNIENDFEIGLRHFEALEIQSSGNYNDSIYWFSAHNDLDGDISLLILEELLASNKTVAQLFEPIRKQIDQSLFYKFRLIGAEREAYLTEKSVYIEGTYDFFRVFINQDNRKAELCNELLN